MSKKQNSKIINLPKTQKAKQGNKPAAMVTGQASYKKTLLLYSGTIAFITFIVYHGIFSNGFVNLDDDKYIQTQQLIRTIHWGSIFSTFIMGNYHPLTMLMYAFIYQGSELNPDAYHFISLLVHGFNSCLVLWFVYLLTRSLPVSFITGLLFAIHPMHVESVAWASQLKDVMYAFGFLLSLIFYLQYSENKKRKSYILCLAFFLFSLLSKGMAVALPLVLLLIDYYKNKKLTVKLILEKVPFFVLSIIFGIVAIRAQQSSAAIEIKDMASFPIYERLILASYAFITYITKLILPLNLVAFYPYPIKPGDHLPFLYVTYVAGVLAIFIAAFYLLKKTKKPFFGLAFFLLTILMVLQLLPVGGSIMADRYTYISSIGIFYLMAEGVFQLSKQWNAKQSGIMAWSIAGAYMIFLCFQANTYVSVWKDSAALWNNVIEHHPDLALAYNNRGAFYKEKGDYNQAIPDFTKCIELNPKSNNAFLNRAMSLAMSGKTSDALSDFNSAIQLNPSFAPSYYNRGITYLNLHDKEGACNDFKKAADLGDAHASDAYRDLCLGNK